MLKNIRGRESEGKKCMLLQSNDIFTVITYCVKRKFVRFGYLRKTEKFHIIKALPMNINSYLYKRKQKQI